MKKIRLSVDELDVASFEVAAAPVAGAGTVHGRGGGLAEAEKTPGRLGTCFPGICTCDGLETCDQSGCYACPASDPIICRADAVGEVAVG